MLSKEFKYYSEKLNKLFESKEMIEDAINFIEYTLEFNSHINDDEKKYLKNIKIDLEVLSSPYAVPSDPKTLYEEITEFLKKYGFVKE